MNLHKLMARTCNFLLQKVQDISKSPSTGDRKQPRGTEFSTCVRQGASGDTVLAVGPAGETAEAGPGLATLSAQHRCHHILKQIFTTLFIRHNRWEPAAPWGVEIGQHHLRTQFLTPSPLGTAFPGTGREQLYGC